MEISSSCHTDAKMVIEGSPSDTRLNIAIEEKMESKEGVLASSSATESAIQGIAEQPVVGVVNCDQEENTIFSVNGSVSTKQDLCQDDMFSLAELSAVEDQTEQLLEEATACTADILTETSNKPELGSGKVSMTIPFLGEGSEESLEDRHTENTNGQLLEKGKGEHVDNVVSLNNSAVNMDTNNGNSLVVTDNRGSGLESQPEKKLIETSSLEEHLPGNVRFEVGVEPSSDIHDVAHESGKNDNDQLTTKAGQEVDSLIEEVPQNVEPASDIHDVSHESGKIDNDQLTTKAGQEVDSLIEEVPQNVEPASDIHDVSQESGKIDNDQLTSKAGQEVDSFIEEVPQNVEPASDIHDVSQESGKIDNDQLTSKAGEEVDSLIEEVPQNVEPATHIHDVAHESGKIDNDQLTSKAGQEVDSFIEEVPQNDFVKSDTDQLTSRGVDSLIEEVPQKDFVESNINQLMGIVVEEVDATVDLQNEAERNNSDHLTSESCVGVISTEELSNSAMAIDDLKEEEKLEQNNLIDVEKLNKMGGHGNEHVTELMDVHGLPIEAGGSTSKNIGECEHGAKEIDNIPDASATFNEHVSEPSKNIPELFTEAMDATNAVTCSSEHNLKCVENGLVLPVETNDATNDNINDMDQKESIKLNQVTLNNSLYGATVINVEMSEIHSIPSEIEGMKEEQKSQCIQESQMVQIKEEEESIQNQFERIPSAVQSTLADDHQSEGKESQQIQPPISVSSSGTQQETACMDIDVPAQGPSENAMQSTLADDHQSEGKESQQIQLPMSVSSRGSQQETACMDIDIPAQGPSENAMQSQNTPKQVGDTKEEIVSVDLGRPCEEVTLVKQEEKALENTPKTISHDLKRHEGANECHAEHMEYRDGEQSLEIRKENEAFKGRKVLKRFNGKMFYGEVIGYDHEEKYFKVLYEDGDEEEFERDELDDILVSDDGPTRKRRATDEDKEGRSSGRKSMKLDEHATPGGQKKNKTPKDKTSGSHPSSSSKKKKKSSVSKSGGKSKSPKTAVRKKKQKGKSKVTSTKKSVEKEKATSTKKSGEKEKATNTQKSAEKEKGTSTKKSAEKEKGTSTKKSAEKEKGTSTKKSVEKEKAASTKKSVEKEKGTSTKKSVEKEKAASTTKSLGKKNATPTKKSVEKEKVEKEKATKKSQFSHDKGNPKGQTKQGSSMKEVVENSENPHQSVTKKLKYGSAKKKTPTNSKQKSKKTPEEDKQVETPQKLMTDKSEVAKPGRKRKAISDIEGGISTVSSKRAKKEKTVNDVESLPAKRTRSGMVLTEVQLQGKEEKGESGKTPASGKIRGESESGVVLVGRKVRKDFGEVYNGEIVKYSKGHYTVKYEDGDTEDLTLEEVESILFHEGVSLPNKKGKQHNKSKSAKSAQSAQSAKSVKSPKSGKPNGKKKN